MLWQPLDRSSRRALKEPPKGPRGFRGSPWESKIVKNQYLASFSLLGRTRPSTYYNKAPSYTPRRRELTGFSLSARSKRPSLIKKTLGISTIQKLSYQYQDTYLHIADHLHTMASPILLTKIYMRDIRLQIRYDFTYRVCSDLYLLGTYTSDITEHRRHKAKTRLTSLLRLRLHPHYHSLYEILLE